MSLNRSRHIGIVVAAAVAASLSGVGMPAAAADSPEAAVEAFFDMAAAGDFSAIDDVVCAPDRDAIREAFDFSAQLGMDDDASIADALSLEISDRSVETIDQDGDTATVAARATMTMSVPHDQVDAIVRAVLESELGPDDPPVTDEDVQAMAGFMGSALNQTQPIDAEVTVTREAGQWLVCGGLVEEPDRGIEPSVSNEGLCGIATPDELSAAGSLEYDSSNGFGEFCTYSTIDYDDFHSASISLSFGQDAATLASYFGSSLEVQVAGAPGFLTGADPSAQQLLVQVGDDTLQISVAGDDDADFDRATEATAIAELLIPRLPAIREAIAGPTPEPTPQPTPEISLCEGLSLDDLNAQTGLGLDDMQGDRYYCGYNQLDGEPGWHTVTMSLSELALDDYRSFLPEAQDTTVAGQPALIDATQLIVELPGGAWSLAVAGFVDPADGSVALGTEDVLRLVAEAVVPTVVVPEATLTGSFDGDTSTPTDSAGGKPLCDYVDLDAINALGILEFDEVSGFDVATCSISRTDPEKDFATVGITTGMGDFDEIRSFYPDAQDVAVAGLPGFLYGPELYVDAPIGSLAFFAFMPEDAVADGLAEADVLLPIAELVVAAMDAAST